MERRIISHKYNCIFVAVAVMLFLLCMTGIVMADDETVSGVENDKVDIADSSQTVSSEVASDIDEESDHTETLPSNSKAVSNGSSDAVSTDPNRPVEDGDYVIASHADNHYVVDIYGGGTANGTNVQMYEANGGANQRMRIKYVADGGYYTITSAISGKSFDVCNLNNGARKNGANVQLYQVNGGVNQRWAIIKLAGGGFKIQSLASGKMLDFYGGYLKNETNVQVWEDNGSIAQIFDLISASNTRSNKTIEDGEYIIVSAENGFKAVDVYGGASADGTNVEIYDANGSGAQKFRFEFINDKFSGGYYKITHVASGKSLDVYGGSLASGANVQIWSANDSDAQKWLVKEVKKGIYNIVMMASGNFLDITAGNLNNESNITVYQPNGGENQQFVLRPAVATSDIKDGVYTIFSNQDNNKVIELENSNIADGTKIRLNGSNSGTNQKFVIQKYGSGYRIMSCISGKVMDVYRGEFADGTNIVTWTNNNGLNQRFSIRSVGDGTFYIVASNGKVVSVSSTGDSICIREATGGDDQKFKLQLITDYKPIEDGAYVIEASGDTDYALDVYDSFRMQNVNIQLYHKNGGSNQIFKLTRTDDGLYYIQNVYSRHVLDVYNGDLFDGANVLQYGINGGKNQKWLVIVNKDGTITFVNDGTGKALNVSGGKYKDEVNIDQWTLNGAESQKFLLVPASYDKSLDNKEIDYTIYRGLGLGIDVSEFQGNIEWEAVKDSGVTFAIIRAALRGYGSGRIVPDSKFTTNIQGAISAGLPVGVYFFTQAINAAEGAEEADYILNQISNYSVTLPIVIDTESIPGAPARANSLSVAQRTEAIKGFCERIVSRGFVPMIYASTSWLENNLDMSKLSNYKVWVAQWNDKVTYNGSYSCWQYSDNGHVNGISGSVDLDRWCY